MGMGGGWSFFEMQFIGEQTFVFVLVCFDLQLLALILVFCIVFLFLAVLAFFLCVSNAAIARNGWQLSSRTTTCLNFWTDRCTALMGRSPRLVTCSRP